MFRRSDIVLENFKPGALVKFGLDYESARAVNESLIYLSISGFGTAEGSWLPGYDLVVQAVSGLMSLTGAEDGPAFRAGISVFDVMTGLHGTIGVLAALNQRRETGEGQHVEVNLLSSAMSGLVNQTGAFVAGGVVPHRMGNEHPSVYPYQTMPTKDRDIIITAANDRQFRSLCEVLDVPELADDARFRLNADRTANRAELHPLLIERLATWSADDLFVALNKVGVPCGPVNSIAEGVELAERLGLEPRVTVGSGDREVDVVRHPITFSGAEIRYTSAPPELGEHSRLRSVTGCRSRDRFDTETSMTRHPPACRPIARGSAPPTPTTSGCSATTWAPTCWARSPSASWRTGWWRSVDRPRANGSCSRPCWSRSPITGSLPRRSPPASRT